MLETVFKLNTKYQKFVEVKEIKYRHIKVYRL